MCIDYLFVFLEVAFIDFDLEVFESIEFLELAFFEDGSGFYHIDEISIHNGFDPVSHDQSSHSFRDPVEGGLDQLLVPSVQS